MKVAYFGTFNQALLEQSSRITRLVVISSHNNEASNQLCGTQPEIDKM